jgi:hypothetical protein
MVGSLRKLAVIVAMGATLVVVAHALAAGTAGGTQSCHFPNGVFENQPYTCSSKIRNGTVAGITYRVYQGYFDKGVLVDSCTGDVFVPPLTEQTVCSTSGVLAPGHHAFSAVLNVGRIDDNTHEFRLRMPLTVRRGGPGPPVTVTQSHAGPSGPSGCGPSGPGPSGPSGPGPSGPSGPGPSGPSGPGPSGPCGT